MQLSDCHWVPSAAAQTWDALHDPAMLKHCLDSQRVTRVRPEEYAIELDTRLAGATHHFKGKILVTDEERPHRIDLAFEGLEEHAGMTLGHVEVHLEAAPHGGTRIRYAVHGAASGELCDLGAKAAHQAVQRLIEAFFTRFTDEMTRLPAMETALATGGSEGHSTPSTTLSWLGLLAVLTVITLYYMYLR